MNKTKIEWCDYTWNPVTGCRRGCKYCYARRIHERFYKTPFSNIVYHPERMAELDSLPRKPSRIFVGSMTDIEYWPRNMLLDVLEKIALCKEHTFMFLSKSVKSYQGITWPSNTMQGLTFPCDIVTMEFQELIIKNLETLPRPYLSIEPILGTLKVDVHNCEQVIVGAMTGPRSVKPEPEWIESVNRHAKNIFWKDNIKMYL